MVNLGKMKFIDYKVKLDVKVFQHRDSLVRYQQSIDEEYELSVMVEKKLYQPAFEKYNSKIEEFKSIILDSDLNEYNSKMPEYLRVFTSSSVYCKILSIFSYEILQKLKKYTEANELFEFLVFKQNLYVQTMRAKWFERV
jgi:hypothetical protein